MEVSQRITDTLADIKLLTDRKLDFNRYVEHHDFADVDGCEPRMIHDLLSQIKHAVDSERETLTAQGRNYETMTVNERKAHLENVVPLILDLLKMHYWELYFDMITDAFWADSESVHRAHESDRKTCNKFKMYAKELLAESHGYIYLVFDTGFFTESLRKLPLVLAYVAQVLVIELMIEGYTRYDEMQDMMDWMVQQIDVRCDDYYAKYGECLIEPKRKSSPALEDGRADKMVKLSEA